MDDLLSELDGIGVDGGSARQDRPSSPLRPNPKYCVMVQPEPIRPAAARYDARPKQAAAAAPPKRVPASKPIPLSGTNLTPISGARQMPVPQRTTTNTSSTSTAGMEIDDEPQILDRSSSPLKPNEKYCSIVPSPKPQVAHVTPIRAAGSSRSQGPSWRPDDEYGRSSPSLGYYNQSVHRQPFPDQYQGGSRQTPPYFDHNNPLPSPPSQSRSWQHPSSSHYSIPSHHWNHPAYPPGPSNQSPYSGIYGPPLRGCGPEYGAGDSQQAKKDWQKELVDWSNKKETFHEHRVEKKREMEMRKKAEAEAAAERERNRAAAVKRVEVARRWQEKQRAKELQQEEERRRLESENAKREEERERKVNEQRRRDADKERDARARLRSYADAPKSTRDGQTVSMTVQELEALKAQCKAEGERKAMEEAKKAETANNDEPEPMDVEESDVVESMIPTSSSSTSIAPKQLFIKVEPVEPTTSTSELSVVSIDDILLPGEMSHEERQREKERREEEKKGRKEEKRRKKEEERRRKEEEEEKKRKEATKTGEAATKDVIVTDGVMIIEKQHEVVTLSDDEDTVADRSAKEIKREEEAASVRVPAAAIDDELWIVGAKRAARPTKHVFDPSKVKKEKEDIIQVKKSDSSASTASIPVNLAKVKPEPADKPSAKVDTAPTACKVKTEPGIAAGGEEKEDTVDKGATVDRSDRLTSQQLPEYDEDDGGAMLPSFLLHKTQPIPASEEERVQAQPPPEMDLTAALASARRLIGEIGDTVQSVQQQKQPRTPRQIRRHEPAPGSFLHALQTTRRKRKTRWDEDEDEEDWLIDSLDESCKCHWGEEKREWIKKEDDEERSSEQRKFSIWASKQKRD